MHSIDGGPKFGFGIGRRIVAAGDGNAVALGQRLQGFPEADAFNFLDKFEDVARSPASETVIELLTRVDGKRWRALLMERADAGVAIGSGTLDQHVAADHVGYIG